MKKLDPSEEFKIKVRGLTVTILSQIVFLLGIGTAFALIKLLNEILP